MDSKTSLAQKPPKVPNPSEATTGNIEVPGVTQLLNRKSLGLAPASAKPSPPSTPSPPASSTATGSTPAGVPSKTDDHTQIQATPLESVPIQQEPSAGGISLSVEAPETFELEQNKMQPTHTPANVTPAPATLQQEPTIKPQTRPRQHHTPCAPLIQWTLDQLSQGTDPLGKGIKQLYPQGVQCALFLKVQTPNAGSNFPHFTSTAAVTPANQLTLWEGLSWYPDITPELWNQFIQAGFVELSPPNTQTVQTSHRNVVRAAFGVQRQEWLLMIRVGSVAACRGVLIVISTASLLPALPATLPLFTADLPKAA